MTECPHGNRPDERCAVCVAAGHGQPGEEHTHRYTHEKATKQYAADTDLQRRNRKLLAARKDTEDTRAAAIESRQQHLNLGKEE